MEINFYVHRKNLLFLTKKKGVFGVCLAQSGKLAIIGLTAKLKTEKSAGTSDNSFTNTL